MTESPADVEDAASSRWLSSECGPRSAELRSWISKSSPWTNLTRSSPCMWLALFTLLSTTAVSAMLAWKRLSNSTASFDGNQNDFDTNSASQGSVFNESHRRTLETLFTSTANPIMREPSGSPISQYVQKNTPKILHTRSPTKAAPIQRDVSIENVSLDSVPTSYDEENLPDVHSNTTVQEMHNSNSTTKKHLNKGTSVSSDSTSTLTGTLQRRPTSVVSTDREPMVKTVVSKAEAVSASRSHDVIFADTAKGTVIGRKRKLLGKEVAVFLGIPYAADTGGPHRFSASRPVDRWNSAFDASKARAPCYQSPRSIRGEHPSSADHRNSNGSSYTPAASEDCLHVNVWAPICNNTYCSGLTVMVFFHGGVLRAGANVDRLYEGSVLAVRGRVVVVVPNYRLGVFGFPSRDITGAARNPGLLDLNMAVRWVRENVAAFGGSAADIVLFGSGWGSYLAGLFLVSPTLRTYFGVSRVILSSGSPLLKSSHEQNSDDHWSGFLAAVGCYETEESQRLACLRNATASSLAASQDRFPGVVGLLFPDDLVLPEPPSEFMAESRTYTSIEALVTNVMSEGRAQYQRLIASQPHGFDPSVESLMNAVGLAPVQLAYSNHVQLQAEVRNHYKQYGGVTNIGSFGAEFLGDVLYNCPLVQFANRLCSGRARVIHLLLAESQAGSSASHGDDLPLVFGESIARSVRAVRRSSTSWTDVAYSEKLVTIWTDFAKNGLQALSAEFPPFCNPDTNGTSTAVYRDRVVRLNSWKQKQCSFLNRYLLYHAVRSMGPLASLQVRRVHH